VLCRGVGLTVVAVLRRKLTLQTLVRHGGFRLRAQVVAEGNRFDPLPAVARNEVEVMRAELWRRLAEPVLGIGAIWR
jgi:hypothetical protein